MDGKLFSQDFLLDGIKTTPIWEALPDDVLNIFINDLKRIYAPLTADSQLNEANTEADIIERVLDLLGWNGLTLKQVTASSTRREDVPDFLLFPNGDAKQSARAERRDDRRYRHGIPSSKPSAGCAHWIVVMPPTASIPARRQTRYCATFPVSRWPPTVRCVGVSSPMARCGDCIGKARVHVQKNSSNLTSPSCSAYPVLGGTSSTLMRSTASSCFSACFT